MNDNTATDRDIAMLGRTAELYPLQYHAKRCENCRYFRIHKTVAVVSECLLHGRTLGISDAFTSHQLYEWARARMCALWAKRPKSWVIFSEGVEKNPHFHDPYISRETNQRRRARIVRAGLPLHQQETPE